MIFTVKLRLAWGGGGGWKHSIKSGRHTIFNKCFLSWTTICLDQWVKEYWLNISIVICRISGSMNSGTSSLYLFCSQLRCLGANHLFINFNCIYMCNYDSFQNSLPELSCSCLMINLWYATNMWFTSILYMYTFYVLVSNVLCKCQTGK